ncbi:MAG: hypothetical protein K2H96_03535 [Muribaculaceae bacterium]|nr:hypothetical protein [Muribaculaceae bacterium]
MKTNCDTMPNSENNIKRLLRQTVNSYILFNNREQAAEILSRKFDKIADINNPIDIEMLYHRCADRCKEVTDYPLDFILTAYVKASELCINKDYWKGMRSSRKKAFAMKLFIKCYMPTSPNVKAILTSISNHEKDDALLNNFFIESKSKELVDVCFAVLILRNIIEPYSTKRSKYQGPNKSKLIEFLKSLNDLLEGNVGVFRRLQVVEEYIKGIESGSITPTIAGAWKILDEIGTQLRYLSIEQSKLIGDYVCGVKLPGIWIDDADQGKNRFWIFPDNYKMAFCYTLKEYGLSLKPYEFVIYYNPNVNDSETCGLVSPEGNRQILIDGYSSPGEMVQMNYDVLGEDESEKISQVTFTPIYNNFGDWFNWRQYRRLDEQDPLYVGFKDILSACYNTERKYECCEVRCMYGWMIDFKSALVAIDNNYLYLMEHAKNERFYLKSNDGDVFEYLYGSSRQRLPGLFDLNVSEENPLYLLPRNDWQFSRFDAYFSGKNISKDELTKYQSFKEVVKYTDFNHQITFYCIHHNGENKKILVFNEFQCVFNIDSNLLNHYGIRIIKQIKDLFKKE